MSSPRDAPTAATARPGLPPFRYLDRSIDVAEGAVELDYGLGELRFTERYRFGPGGDWGPRAHELVRLLHLLAGVSYYKALAPPVVELGDTALRPGEVAFLQRYFVDGLGEFALRQPDGLDLTDLRIVADELDSPPAAAPATPTRGPLVPFGGGLDSIVSVELLRDEHPDLELFVLERPGARFEAIEDAIAASSLTVARAERELDPLILSSAARGWRNGHVPITAIVSTAALLRAVLDGRDTVVMSNEWSASSGNVVVDGREVNHQFSKSLGFESAYRDVLAAAVPGVEWFSLLRPYSELWIARRFAEHTGYHRVFRSCNRAFTLDPARRLDHWCGRCDKCCFIDLVLSPFLPTDELDAVFGGREPLADGTLRPQFAALLDLSGDIKPFECVGDVDECRSALVLAAERPDRAEHALVHELVDELGDVRAAAARDGVARLLRPMGRHHVPAAFAADDLAG